VRQAGSGREARECAAAAAPSLQANSRRPHPAMPRRLPTGRSLSSCAKYGVTFACPATVPAEVQFNPSRFSPFYRGEGMPSGPDTALPRRRLQTPSYRRSSGEDERQDISAEASAPGRGMLTKPAQKKGEGRQETRMTPYSRRNRYAERFSVYACMINRYNRRRDASYIPFAITRREA